MLNMNPFNFLEVQFWKTMEPISKLNNIKELEHESEINNVEKLVRNKSKPKKNYK